MLLELSVGLGEALGRCVVLQWRFDVWTSVDLGGSEGLCLECRAVWLGGALWIRPGVKADK